jgi:hypothetical protein
MKNTRKAGAEAKLHLLTVAEQTPCDGCTACCTAVGVREIDKLQGERCRYEVEGGCGIYAQRPASCADFYCCWKFRLAGFGPEDRPDHTNIVFTLPGKKDAIRTALLAFEAKPSAFESDVGKELLTRLVQHGHAIVLVGPNGTAKKLMAPLDHPAMADAIAIKQGRRP